MNYLMELCVCVWCDTVLVSTVVIKFHEQTTWGGKGLFGYIFQGTVHWEAKARTQGGCVGARTEAEINPQSLTVINFIIRTINLHQQGCTKAQAFKINIPLGHYIKK